MCGHQPAAEMDCGPVISLIGSHPMRIVRIPVNVSSDTMSGRTVTVKN
jgi:hypothetical protein